MNQAITLEKNRLSSSGDIPPATRPSGFWVLPLVIMIAATVAGSTRAWSQNQPDLMIRNSGGGAYFTDNMYENPAWNQTTSQSVMPGFAAVYDIILQNDGAGSQTFTVTGTGGAIGWTVQYLEGITDRTSAITGAGYSVALNAAATTTFTVYVTPSAPPDAPAANSTRDVTVTATDGSLTDSVKSTTTVTGVDRCDNMIRLQGESIYLTNDTYESSPSVQVKSVSVYPGSAAVYELLFQNDGNRSSSLTFTGTGSASGFTVRYYDALSGGSNITTAVLGAGQAWTVAAGGTQSARIEVTPDAAPNAPSVGASHVVDARLSSGSTLDIVRATTLVNGVNQADLMVRNLGEGAGAYLTNNAYESTVSTQVKAQSVNPGSIATYEVSLQNDGNQTQNITLTGTGSGSGFTVAYYNALSGGSDITSSVTSVGYPVSLTAGNTQALRFEVTPASGVSGPAAGSSYSVTLSAAPPSGGTDQVRGTTTVNAVDRADNMIRNLGDVGYVTDGTYESTPSTQTRAQSVAPGLAAVYELQLQNDGNQTATHTLRGTASGSGFTVRYYDALSGGSEITSNVTGSGATFSLAQGGSQAARIEVIPDAVPNSPASGSSYAVTATLTAGSSTDAVRATTTVNAADQGDLMIRSNGETTFLTNNTYESSPSVQVKSQSVNPGATATYEVQIQNDGNRTQTYTITGSGSSGGFTAQYFNAFTGGTDVTANVTAAGHTVNLAAGATSELRVTVTPGSIPGSPAGGSSHVATISITGGSGDTVRATTTVNNVDQPDNKIRTSSEGSLTGDNVYETTPVTQVKSQTVAPGSSATYVLQVQNDGNRTANHTITGPASSGNFTLQYFDAASGGNDVTSAITGSGLTYSLTAGNTQDLRLVVTPNSPPNSPASGSTNQANITVTAGSVTDVVRANTTVSGIDRSDNMIRNSTDTIYLTDNIYEGTPSDQTRAQTVNPGTTATYHLQLQNDGNQTTTHTLTGGGSSGGFSVQYFNALSGGSDITPQVTGAGASFSLGQGGTQAIRVEVTPTAIPSSPASGSSIALDMSLAAGGTTDVVRATTTVAAQGQADMMVRNNGESATGYLTNNTYESSPSVQVKSQTRNPGATATYEVLLQNDGNLTQNITVTGTATGSGFTVQYFDAFSVGNNITSAVTGSGNVFNNLAAGGSQEIRIAVTPNSVPNAPAGGSSYAVNLIATPQSGGVDSVRATTTVSSQDKADLMIRNKGETTYATDDTYESTPSGQIKTRPVDPGATATYELLLENDGNSTITYTLTGTGSGSGFTARYYNALSGGTEITSGVTGAGQTFSLAGNGRQSVRVEVTPAAVPSSPAGGYSYSVDMTLRNSSSSDSVRATTTVNNADRSDAMIRKSGDTTYLTNDVYETTPTVQVVSQKVDPGSVVHYEIRLQNDGNRSQTYTVTGSASSAGFAVQYFDSTNGGVEVTSSVTGTGQSYSLARGEFRDLRLSVWLTDVPNAPPFAATKVVNVTLAGGGTTDIVQATTEVNAADQGDIMVRKQGETAFVSNDIYEATPTTQVKTNTVPVNVGAVYEFRIQNDGNRKQEYTVKGGGTGEKFTVLYFDALTGGADVTGSIVGSGLKYTLEAGATRDLRVVVTPDAAPNSPADGSVRAVDITITGGGSTDSVRTETTTGFVDKADLMLRNHDETEYLGNDVYEPTVPLTQMKNQNVNAGDTAIYEFSAQNDGNRTQDYVVTGTGSSTGFDVKYFDALTGGNDITSLVTGAGKTFNLQAGAFVELRVEVTPNAFPNSPVAGTSKAVAVTLAREGTTDNVATSTKVNATDQADGMIRNQNEVDADFATRDFYEAIPSQQVKSQSTAPGVAAVFQLRLQNDGNKTQTFTVVGAGGSTGWSVQYFDAATGGTNITSSVIGAGKTFTLDIGVEQPLRAEVTPSAAPTSPPAETTKDVTVTFFVLGANNTRLGVDSVKATTGVKIEDKSDLMVRNKGEAVFLTDGFYETEPVVQVRSQLVNVGDKAVYELQLQNDGNRSHAFKLKGESGNTNWTVKYFDAFNFGNDITSAVTGDGQEFTIAPGATQESRLEVSANTFPNAPLFGETFNVDVHMAGSTVDAIRATTSANAANQGDLMVKNAGEDASGYLTADLYEATPSLQVKKQSVNPGSSVVYDIKVENDGNQTQDYTITGTGSASGFGVKYFDNSSGSASDVTSSVTGSGVSYNLAVGESKELQLSVEAGANPGGPLAGTVKSVLVSVKAGTSVDAVRVDTTVNAQALVDAMIRTAGEGDAALETPNVYETTPVSQVKIQSVAPGTAAVYEVKIENDGNQSTAFVVTGTADATGWMVRYFDALTDGSNVTGGVTVDGKSITLAPGDSTFLRVEVTPETGINTPTADSTYDVIVKVAGGGEDSVKATTSASPHDQVDLLLRNKDQAAYLGDGTYEPTAPSDQVKEQTVSSGQAAVYEIKIQNDGNQPNDLTLTGEGSSTGFMVKYFDALQAGNDITDQVTGSGKTFSLDGGAATELRIEVTPTASPESPAAGTKKTVTLKLTDGSTTDTVNTVTTVSETRQADLMIRLPGETDFEYLTNNVYEATPDTQAQSQETDPLVADTYEVKLQNDGNVSATYTITGIGDSSGWSVAYYDAHTGGNNISTAVTDSGHSFTLDVGAAQLVRVVVTPTSTSSSIPTSKGVDLTAFALVNGQQVGIDSVKATTTVDTTKESVIVGTGENRTVLISLPSLPADFDPFVGGFLDQNRNSFLARWNAQKANDSKYKKYQFIISGGSTQRPDLIFSDIEEGRGYWRAAGSPYQGRFSSRSTDFELPLYAGTQPNANWNQIGVPFTKPVDISSLKVVQGGSELTLAEAATQGIVGNIAWKYTNPAVGYELIALPESGYANAGTSLEPGLGYWFLAYQTVTLKYPAPTSGGGAAVVPLSMCSQHSGDGWKVQLRAKAGDYADAFNYFGTAQSQRSIEKPPVPPEDGYLAVYFEDKVASRRLASALTRSVNGRLAMAWDFVVETNLNRDVELSWPDLSEVPKDLNLYLEDAVTQKRVYMRTQTAYRFPAAGNGAPRRFRITGAPRQTGALLLQNLTLRSGGERTAVSVSQASFVLSKTADVQVRILDGSGRVMSQSQLPNSRAGINTVQVPHTNRLGHILPRGRYLCEVVATTAEGQTIKVVRAFTIR